MPLKRVRIGSRSDNRVFNFGGHWSPSEIERVTAQLKAVVGYFGAWTPAAIEIAESLKDRLPLIAHHNPRSAADLSCLYEELLDAIAKHRVGDRPDRFKPRLQKRRNKRYPFLGKPRATLEQQMAKRVT